MVTVLCVHVVGEAKDPSINDERLQALCILTYSDNVELQRSAALCFAEISQLSESLLSCINTNIMQFLPTIDIVLSQNLCESDPVLIIVLSQNLCQSDPVLIFVLSQNLCQSDLSFNLCP